MKFSSTSKLPNIQGILIAVFEYIRGLHPHTLLEWFTYMRLCRELAAGPHIGNLYCIFRAEGKQYEKFYGFNVSNFRYEYINGTVQFFIIIDYDVYVTGKEYIIL